MLQNSEAKSKFSRTTQYLELQTQLLCFGYVREFCEKKYSPAHIATVTFKYVFIEWKWDYYNTHYDNKYHQIIDDNKVFECNTQMWNCNCFVRCNFGMTPNCGIFNIKIKFNLLNNRSGLNGIGITTNVENDNNSTDSISKGWHISNDCIIWSARSQYNDTYCKNGILFTGLHDYASNIFYKSGIKYESNNEYNKESLPRIDTNDIIIMSYDSNNNILNFIKENDMTCNCKITNLPKNKTCYWFVGHGWKKMSVSIL